MVKTKPEDKGGLRTPGPKKKLGLIVPPALRMPHEDLITPILSPAETLTSHTTRPSQTSQASQARRTRQSSQTRQTPQPEKSESFPIAPERDFMKTANSIVREAVPSGVFKGKSKQLYDALYSLTRGAIVPARRVRISRPKLMAKAGIGSRVTFDVNVRHLTAVRLIVVRQIAGEHEGNEYEVFLPEEVAGVTSLTSHSSQTSPALKVDRLVGLESSQTSQSLSTTDTNTSGDSKTFSKDLRTIDDDDAALAGMFAALKSATEEITGRKLSRAEAERWKELADVLIAELKIAAGRTTISSVPAFLAEHLRRRLWKVDKKQARAEGRELPDETISSTPQQETSKDCPDCGGSGWWYPEGPERGVAKCKHAQLKQAAEEEK
jgi:hypothetical protein